MVWLRSIVVNVWLELPIGRCYVFSSDIPIILTNLPNWQWFQYLPYFSLFYRLWSIPKHHKLLSKCPIDWCIADVVHHQPKAWALFIITFPSQPFIPNPDQNSPILTSRQTTLNLDRWIKLIPLSHRGVGGGRCDGLSRMVSMHAWLVENCVSEGNVLSCLIRNDYNIDHILHCFKDCGHMKKPQVVKQGRNWPDHWCCSSSSIIIVNTIHQQSSSQQFIPNPDHYHSIPDK